MFDYVGLSFQTEQMGTFLVIGSLWLSFMLAVAVLFACLLFPHTPNTSVPQEQEAFHGKQNLAI